MIRDIWNPHTSEHIFNNGTVRYMPAREVVDYEVLFVKKEALLAQRTLHFRAFYMNLFYDMNYLKTS